MLLTLVTSYYECCTKMLEQYVDALNKATPTRFFYLSVVDVANITSYYECCTKILEQYVDALNKAAPTRFFFCEVLSYH